MNTQILLFTEINGISIHIRLGEENGINKRPTPTAKKWRTRVKGREFNPESRDIGPSEN